MRCEQELLSNMSFVPFGDLLLEPLRNGLTKPKAVRGDGVKMIGMGEIFANSRIGAISMSRVPVTEKELSNNCIKNGDILFARQSLALEGAGKCSIVIDVTEKTVFESHLIRARIDSSKANPYFVYYYFNSYVGKEHIKTIVEQVAAAGIRGSDLVRLKVPCPDLETQDRIAAILSALDEKIATNRAINENLERQAQALFKSWFVDFDSVSKLGFTESELGDIPYGWRIYTLSEFLPVKTGKKNANVSSDKGAYPFFSCSQDFSWTDEYSFEGHAILVAGNGDFNVKWYNGKFEAYQRTYVLIPYVERYTDWLYYAVKYNLESITSAARGSVIKFITKGNLENFAFAAPENLEKCEIIDIFSSINRIIDALTQENYRLAEIRDSLLPKLMAGEIDVSAVQL